MKKYDYLIVGSGLYGLIFAYLAKQQDKKCLVLEKRNHIGGNIYCDTIDGINIHKYGAHIFHTNNKKIWDFITSLVPFNNYINSPLANFKGNIYNLPLNMNTFYQMWGKSSPADVATIIEKQCTHIRSPHNLEEQALNLVGSDIYNILIKGYTEKQWGRPCKELPPSIIKRLPVRLTYNNNYFNDAYQGIPIGGYNKLIYKLINGIEYRTNTDFLNSEYRNWKKFAKYLIYTGPLDAYFNYRFGKLDWRTITFDVLSLNKSNYQGNAVINFTSPDVPYTRIIEHKHFEVFNENVYDNPKTVISKEYSTEYKIGMEPYYPINDIKNNKLANKYKKLALHETNVIFGGRLAEYKYYDMDDIIEQAIKTYSCKICVN